MVCTKDLATEQACKPGANCGYVLTRQFAEFATYKTVVEGEQFEAHFRSCGQTSGHGAFACDVIIAITECPAGVLKVWG